MRILILTQYFAPEITAARVRLEAFADGLRERGHEIEVVCAVPNHPQGVVQPEYRRRLVSTSDDNGIEVRRVWVRASPRKTARNRILLYGSYAATAAAVASVSPRPDVILASSPPLTVGAAAACVAARHRVPWIFDVRDLWPEAAIALGELEDGRIARMAARLERRLYRSAAAIVTVTESFRGEIAAHLADPEKVHVVMNGTSSLWLEAGRGKPEREALGLPEDRFVWAYAGNLGIAQGLEAAIDAAGILGESYQLVLLGDGPRREALERRAAALPSASVAFRGLVQPEGAARYLRSADALLVSLDAQPAFRKYVPSKIFDCLAVGRPVILAAAGESERLLGEAGAGVTVPPGQPELLAGAVRGLRDDRERSESLGKAGREFAARHNRELEVDRLEALMRAVVE